jgi:hypothetical protein
LREILGCPVGLPDGKQELATKEGTTILHGGLKIENVLYVPKLNYNLKSISQLIDEKIVLYISLIPYVLCRTTLRRC